MIITICTIIYTNDTTTCGILNSLTICFNTVLKLVLCMQITSVLNAKDLLFAHKNKMNGN
ncbi:hypothetical protein DXA26_09280 [Bacteroides fragilis]|nr:hypothetical protein F3B26_05880 [Bacteroides fragilis]RGO00108.1 hypothetical protein DXB33_11355 [Bacteroides fragilis]RGO62358.1 hypothetical protein DXB09_05065 [Bacteroides fragilis]RGY74698.1 hypothetical protein DXA26_09280 [Bacteroides fragilis]